MRPSRFWLVLVILLCCVPLFYDLGKGDLQTDESIYSFAVDRILETGDWLVPKSSPNEDWAFLEKPPLKFWIVAAPIRAGLLPLNEFSLRVWDAVFASAAFVYVFLIGDLLAGPICGAVSVLVFFTFGPLLFEHGVRGNNMEASLLLSYCGGVYHFFRWARAETGRKRHAFGVGLYFVLGFMTKFVAAIFLPMVLVAGSFLTREFRRKLLRDWRLWSGVSLAALALIAPWFIFATVKFGRFVWDMMLREHVYTRFTHFLDPTHVQPWDFYWRSVYRSFSYAGSTFIIAAGLIVLAVQAVKKRWPEAAIVLAWFVLPMTLVSFGTSKLIHYIYPFLPPLALAAGYGVALALRLLPAPLERILHAGEFESTAAERSTSPVRRAIGLALRRPRGRRILLGIALVATVIAVATLIYGQIRLGAGGTVIFKSSGVLRPAIVAIICWVLAGESRRAARVVVPLLVAGLLPLPAYRQTFERLEDAPHPLRTARDCLLDVEQKAGTPVGLYVDVPGEVMWHPIYYYFRRVRPWTRTEVVQPAAFNSYLNDPSQYRPILIWEKHYDQLVHPSNGSSATAPANSPPMATFAGDMLLLLPGPFSACSAARPVIPAAD